MPYLGNIPATQFAELKYQDFTGGTGTSFTLNDPVGSAQELEVFVNNVRQEPGVAYTVSGTALTMTGSIVASDDFYVVFQGKSVGTATHPAGQALTATDGTFTSSFTSPGIDDNADATAITIDSSENVGIGTTSPQDTLHIGGTGTTGIKVGTQGSTGRARIFVDSSNDYALTVDTQNVSDALVIERTTGNVGIGANDPNRGSHNRALLVSNTGSGARSAIEIEGNSSNANGRLVYINNGTNAFALDNRGGGVATFNIGSNLDEKMRLETNNFLIGKSSSSFSTVGARFLLGSSTLGQLELTTNGQDILNVNRLNSDGSLVRFFQDNSMEGQISVSGSAVSYSGGHLARWSRLTDNSKDTSILRGTVMTNLDQMVVWHHDAEAATYYEEGDELPDGVSVGDEKTPAVAAYDEDNEQLNCMAVSSVEGDANVAGVFVGWDNDDDGYNDMNIGMTGDFVIRIAQGTTVARGDLLMSAGDGTAKPQGDDIVRSKTIAKVTSTNVSHTYDDGSYLVPCVLMAC